MNMLMGKIMSLFVKWGAEESALLWLDIVMMLANSWYVTLIKMKPSWGQAWRPVCHLNSCWKKLWPEADNELGCGEGIGWHTEYPLVSHWSSRIPTGCSWRSCWRVNWEGAWTDDSAWWTRRWMTLLLRGLSWLLVLWRLAWAHCSALMEGLQNQMTWISHYFWSPTFYGSVPETYAEDGSCHSTLQGAALTCTRRHSSSVHSLVPLPSPCCPFCTFTLTNLSQEFWCYPNKYKH